MLPLQNWPFSFLLRSHIKAQIAAKGLNPNLKGFKLKNLQTQISLHSRGERRSERHDGGP